MVVVEKPPEETVRVVRVPDDETETPPLIAFLLAAGVGVGTGAAILVTTHPTIVK